MNITYQLLKEELDGFSYVNSNEVFYFILNSRIYSYNLITDNLSVVAEDVDKDSYIVDADNHYIAWENTIDKSKVTEIYILDLETGEKDSLRASNNEIINLLGKIDNNIIYGYGKKNAYMTTPDGTLLTLMYEIEITDKNKKILKNYQKDGYFITGAYAEGNIITLKRAVKGGGGEYEEADDDYILNSVAENHKVFHITERVTEKMLTEYYISLPSGFSMEKLPLLAKTKNTIITEDTTLRLKDSIFELPAFTVYAKGEAVASGESAGEAIENAFNVIGTVMNSKQQIIWERIIRRSTVNISGVTPIYSGQDSKRSCVAMLSSYKKGYDDSSSSADSLVTMLKEKLGDSYLNISGANLEQALYYVNRNQPVIAMKNKKEAVLIVGFDMYNITVIDPSLGRTMKIGLKDAGELFDKAGNMFYTYFDENVG